MKTVLGLDLGTNSIGAALIRIPQRFEDFGKEGSVEWLGSRIIPVDGEYLQKFESGVQAETKAAARRMKRGSRRLKHRYKMRRSRLTNVLKILGWVNEDFPLDNPKRIKEIIRENDGRFEFRISDYLPFAKETIDEATAQLGVLGKYNKNGNIVIPEDWIVYFLRKKALRQKITVQELCRILYMMNQRRGFKSSRKDLKESTVLNYEEFNNIKKQIDAGELSEYINGEGRELKTQFVSITKIKSVTLKNDVRDKKGKLTFVIGAEDPRLETWEEKRIEKPEWEGKEFRFIVEQSIDKKGKSSQNKPQIPKEDDWNLLMVALDNQIDESGKYVGEFFWDKLVESTRKKEVYKIRQNVVRREKYQKELQAIWNKQVELRTTGGTQEELLNTDKLERIVNELYRHNTAKQNELKQKGLLHILANDIIYYQRDLKSQKNLISECRFEKQIGKEKNENGEFIETGIYGLKCTPKSSPEFQEFRIWQDVHSIRILEREKIVDGIKKVDVDVTRQFIDETNKDELYDLFDTEAEITEKKIFDWINKIKPEVHLDREKYRINLFSNRETLKGNETKTLFRRVFRRFDYESQGEKLLQNADAFYKLWHIVYSISSSDLEKSAKGIRTALKQFKFSDSIVEAFTKLEDFKKEYAAYSSKAIKKLLTVMRCGKYWKWVAIEQTEIKTPESPIDNPERIKLSERIDKIVSEGWERDIKVDKRTGEIINERHFEKREQFSGLPVWMACYVVYGRHSERETRKKFSLEEIKKLDIMALVPHNSLRNPIVEQVVRETLCLVKDISKEFGQPDEIHIELGRDLKKNMEQRQAISENNAKNLEEKIRAKKLLQELLNGDFEHFDEAGKKVKGQFTIKPNPNNPVDIEKFRVYKSLAAFEFDKKERKTEDRVRLDQLFRDGKKERVPTNAEVKKYILWLSQKCISPYTGRVIPLSKLFDETQYEVEHIIPRSRMKYDAMDNLVISETGVNKAKGNELAANFIARSSGKCTYGGIEYTLFTYEEYSNHCKRTFRGKKYKNLMATEVPQDFIERQINDTRYIGKKLGELLYPFVKEREGVVFTIGSITSELRGKWGLNKVWKQLLKQRFERLERITGNRYIFPNEDDRSDSVFNVPEIPDLDIKRLDHRHHALDALIIAATTREHIRYLNSLSAADTNEELRQYHYTLCKGKIREFRLPWEAFTRDAKEKLSEVVVTFKSNKHIVSKPFNRYMKWIKKEDGTYQKQFEEQEPNERWLAVRKSLFKEPQGIIWLKEKRKVSVKEAFRIQIERLKVEHDKEKRRTAAYVYDQNARLTIKEIIQKTMDVTGIDLISTNELLHAIEENYLRKNVKKAAAGKGKAYSLGGKTYNEIEIAEFVMYKAKRVRLDGSFDHKKIDKIPYSKSSRIPVLLHKHLREYEKKKLGRAEAFSNEGLEQLAKKNNGMPITTVTIMDGKLKDEHLDNLFGNKYMEPDAGSIAYFIIYENEITKGRTEMYSLSTHKALERIKRGEPIADKRVGYKTIILSPNDLVYVPTDGEWKRIKAGEQNVVQWNDKKSISNRIYRMVSADDAFFVQHHISKPIIPTILKGENKTKGEIDWHNKSTKTMDGKITIADRCIKIVVDRLANIRPA
jgi:CRISPR-associated endonuclease Csn1